MKKKLIYILITMSLVFFIPIAMSMEADETSGLKISSPGFENNGYMPAKYTCDGMNANPPLFIQNVPLNSKTMALIVDDPDAPSGIWVHWVLWNISPNTKEIKENSFPEGAKQGLNDFGWNNYGAPCPPSGTHRYFFKLYALDTILKISTNSTKADLERAMKGHIIDSAQIVGLYKRR